MTCASFDHQHLPGRKRNVDGSSERTQEILMTGAEALELSFVELVVAVSECSEDANEIIDLLDDLLDSDRISITESPAQLAGFEAGPPPQ
jgi:hypothetical protein